MKRFNHLKVVGFFCLLVCLQLFLLTTAAMAAESLLLALGQQKTLSTPGVSRVAVGAPDVADVKVLEQNQKVLITARGLGKTNLIIWEKNNQERVVMIEVVGSDPKEIAKEVKSLLHGIEGISVKETGRRVVIDGYVLKRADLEKVTKIASLYAQVMNLATLSPAVIDLAIEHINREFATNNLEKVRAKRMANQIALEGTVINEIEKEKAELIAKAYGSDLINFIEVGVQIHDLINISVDFIELSNDDRTKVGIDWNDGLTLGAEVDGEGAFGNNISSALAGTYGLVANYGATINAIKGKGNSRVLAQPKLLCRSGEKADFLAGGEVAIPIVTQDTTSVVYKEFGMILKISPIADAEGNIESAIEIENSMLAGFTSNGAPNLHTSRVKTYVNGRDGQTIVLSGIFSASNNKGVEKVPMLGEIPILGELFKSRSFQGNESELLIFVTPTIVKNNDGKIPEEVTKIRKKYDSGEQQVKFKMMD